AALQPSSSLSIAQLLRDDGDGSEGAAALADSGAAVHEPQTSIDDWLLGDSHVLEKKGSGSLSTGESGAAADRRPVAEGDEGLMYAASLREIWAQQESDPFQHLPTSLAQQQSSLAPGSTTRWRWSLPRWGTTSRVAPTSMPDSHPPADARDTSMEPQQRGPGLASRAVSSGAGMWAPSTSAHLRGRRPVAEAREHRAESSDIEWGLLPDPDARSDALLGRDSNKRELGGANDPEHGDDPTARGLPMPPDGADPDPASFDWLVSNEKAADGVPLQGVSDVDGTFESTSLLRTQGTYHRSSSKHFEESEATDPSFDPSNQLPILEQVIVQSGRPTILNRGPKSMDPEMGVGEEALTMGAAGQKGFMARVLSTKGSISYGQEYQRYRSLGIFGPRSRFRRLCIGLMTSFWFEMLVLVMIAASAIFLAMNGPTVQPGSTLDRASSLSDIVFTSVFTFEMVVKMVAMGLFLHPGAYFRIPWNLLDFVIVVTSLASLAADVNIVALRSLRLLRVLRPLRLISYFKLFAGKLYSCNQNVLQSAVTVNGMQVMQDITLRTRAECVPGQLFNCTQSDDCPNNVGQLIPRVWQNSYYNFDNVGNGMLTLFVVATIDNPMDIIGYQTMDAVGIDLQPSYDHNPAAGLYTIGFILIGSFFWVNLLTTAIVDNYSQLINQMGASPVLTEEQKKWVDVLRLRGSQQRPITDDMLPKNWLRRGIVRATSSVAFDECVLVVIIANVVILAMDYNGETDGYRHVLNIISNAITIAFVAEAVVKVVGYGPWAYISDNWNKLDLVVVGTSVPSLFISAGPAAQALRIVRMARMFKLVGNAKGLRTLFNTLLTSLPAIINIASLFLLVMFIYAVLGMDLFGSPSAPLAGIRNANMLSFGAAMLTLLRALTFDDWSLTLQAAQGCTDQGYACGNYGKKAVAAIYFTTFAAIGGFVLVQLVVAVILEKFVESATSEGLFAKNNFFEVMHRKILLDRFMKQLQTKVQYRKAQGGKRVRRKSVLNTIFDTSFSGGERRLTRRASMVAGVGYTMDPSMMPDLPLSRRRSIIGIVSTDKY
ncbi:hypothetical protein WJX84_008306, partial [Apatococcus fuscideae]